MLEIATSSVGFAMTTYVAQNLGAGRFDRIHSGVRSAFWAAIATARVIGETGLFIAEVAAWAGAVVVLVFSYFYTVRKAELKYKPK